MTRVFIFVAVVLGSASCSYVPKVTDILPDKKNEYKKSEALPDLEVPPDLTAEAINDSMSIPNEGASLSQYNKSRQGGGGKAAPAEQWSDPDSDEKWIAVRGNNSSIWPRLRAYFSGLGYGMDLDDAELGVMETGYGEPYVDGGFTYRDKFKIFSEPGSEPSITRLFISNQRQVLAKKADGSDSWTDKGQSKDAESKLAGDLNAEFNGSRDAVIASASSSSSSSTSAAPAAPRQKTLVQTTEDGKEFLAVPAEFTRAWRHIEIALERAGLPVASKDQAQGIYNVMYFDPRAGEQKKGFFSKLKFWSNDEAPEGVPYQISLTGVGDKTEVVIIDAEGEWATNNDALQIMAILQNHLNQ